MSVLINMEMPTSCFYCPFREKVNPDDYVCMALNKEFEETFSLIVGRRHENCPLVPAADVVEASRVVEIVHCKECKFGEWNAVECAYWCQGRFHRPDWYCADAKSKYEDVIK